MLFAQRDLLEARTVLIETKQQQLSAIVNAYQALGGGLFSTGMVGVDAIYGTQPEFPPGEGAELPPLPPAPGESAGNEKARPKMDAIGRPSVTSEPAGFSRAGGDPVESNSGNSSAAADVENPDDGPPLAPPDSSGDDNS